MFFNDISLTSNLESMVYIDARFSVCEFIGNTFESNTEISKHLQSFTEPEVKCLHKEYHELSDKDIRKIVNHAVQECLTQHCKCVKNNSI